MNTLIVGGTSGLGLGLGVKYSENGHKVIVTGRHDPGIKNLNYIEFDLRGLDLASRIEKLVNDLPEINVLIYTAGAYQEGTITDLREDQIEDMINICGRGLMYLVRAVLQKQEGLDELIMLTSSTQYKPQRLEPVYSFMKAGQGHFANSLAEDGRIKKVFVLAPSGTKTEFWRNIKHPDYDNFLDKAWVIEQIIKAEKGDYRYKFVKIFRQPGRVEEVEKR